MSETRDLSQHESTNALVPFYLTSTSVTNSKYCQHSNDKHSLSVSLLTNLLVMTSSQTCAGSSSKSGRRLHQLSTSLPAADCNTSPSAADNVHSTIQTTYT